MAGSYVSSKLSQFGLINETPSPSERVETQTIHEETEAEGIRMVPDRDQDPDGRTIFSSFRSVFAISSADVNNFGNAETWMSDRATVKAVGITPDAFIQWYDPSRIRPTEELTISEAALSRADYAMTRDAGDQGSHGVYVTRNGLLDAAPLNGGWADTDGNNAPDSYDINGFHQESFSSNVYEAFVNTNNTSLGGAFFNVPFPLDNVTVTLSVQVDQLHDDGDNSIKVASTDASGSEISADITQVTSTGRKTVTHTTADDTYGLRCWAIRMRNATTETTKLQVQDPCLRVDGGTTYVPK